MAVLSFAFLFWMGVFYFHFTTPIADFGGTYKEGMLGQPLYANPVFSQTSEVDASLTQLVYSGILKYDKTGNLVNDLAEKYEISEDKKKYTIYLKQGVLWHDGEMLTADDIVFTVNVIKDPAYKSPLRQNWQGVEVKKIDEYSVEFLMEDQPYFRFLDSLTLGVLPKHVWENIAADRFLLTEYNLRPIGTGPFKFVDMQKDSNGNIITYNLKSFADYFGGKAFINNFSFVFYSDEESLISAYSKKEINGINGVSPEKISGIDLGKNTNVYEINVPRYFAVFLNKNKSVPLAEKEVRRALRFGTSSQAVINTVLHEKAKCIDGPFLNESSKCHEGGYDIEKAKSILEESGWKVGDDGVRSRNDVRLRFNLLTIDWPELSNTAFELQNQWSALGAEVEVNVLSVSDLRQNYIRPREYDAILVGQAISFNPDPYSFWHSSQKKDPGFNFSMFENEEADEILLETRKEFNTEKRNEKYNRLEEIIDEESPAVFLYTPMYLYVLNKQIQGIDFENLNDVSHRFSDIEKWYIETKRVRK